MLSQSAAQEVVHQLVQKYDSEKNTFEDPNYNEARTRHDFIEPLFKLLGWDMDNEKRLSQSFREVLYEDKVSIDGNIKHPDYSFRIGNSVLFYVEAKKPSIGIKDNKEAALQLRYYGWNTGLTLSILTNFREFAVYDCRVKPDHKDQAHVARLTYFTYKDLTQTQGTFKGFRDGFDFLWDVFIQEKILRGSFDKFIQDDGDRFKKGVITIDQSFLQTLEDWRLILAKSLCKTNKEISEHDLNYIVSAILNRIVFLRFAEGREIEPFGNLKSAAEALETYTIYKKLFTLFERADEKYNSGLFDLNKDSQGEHLLVENNVLKRIVGGLYYPNPYAFDKIPVEILGSVYERFLGSVVHLTAGHNAKVEPKPEVRKAGGVFYTPQYIVDYIVENTVGDLIKDKTPAEVAKIKVIDPSCGSGSFLLGAYQYLLDWHKNYYTTKYEKEGKTSKGLKNDTLTPFGELATTVKKQILINNIFGVDIDENAVEITKLSLLIKCLEGETTASIENTRLIFHEKALPNIDGNVRCGNSLVDTNFHEDCSDDKIGMKIKPFHWQRAYPQVYKQGGFDVMIGNPPYVDYRLLDSHSMQYFKKHFQSTKVSEKWSLFLLFVERGGHLLKENGTYAMIIPNTLLSANFALQTRKWLLKENTVNRIVDVSRIRVFGQTATYPILLFYQHIPPIQNHEILVGIASDTDLSQLKTNTIDQNEIIENNDKYIVSLLSKRDDINIIRKLDENKTKLKDLTTAFHWGTSISNFRSYKISADDYRRLSQKRKKEYEPVIQTADIKRFGIEWTNEYIQKDIYSLKTANHFKQTKIVIARLTKTIQATVDTEGYYMGKSSYIITDKIDYYYLTALLNSRLINFYFRHRFETTHLSGGYLRFDIPYLGELPIKIIDTTNQSEKQLFDTIVDYVHKLIQFYSEKQEIFLSSRRYTLEDKIAHFERKIDELVYRLYGLTAEEIAIVEESYKPH